MEFRNNIFFILKSLEYDDLTQKEQNYQMR